MTPEFFTLHQGLPREGPGAPDEVEWAVGVAGVAPGARVCDAGSGPGGDVPALMAAIPEGHVTAMDLHADFVRTVAERFPGEEVTARQGDMIDIGGPFDFIWSAGAVYFHGIVPLLTAWRKALAPGGAVAFSHPGWFVETPSEGARAFWQGYDGVMSEAELGAEVARAGYRLLGLRPVSDAGWEAYFGPLDRRAEALRDGANARLTAVLDEAEEESRAWRAHRRETGYWLAVVAPA